MPTDTDVRIRRLCALLRDVKKDDAELERIVLRLHAVLEEHISRAKSSLGTKASVIRKMDPSGKEPHGK